MRFLLFLIILCSCSNMLKRNTTMQSDIVFRGGQYKDKSWSERLLFKRESWYKEINMVYDFSYSKLTQESPFWDWLGSAKLVAGKCDQFYVTLLYVKRNSELTTAAFLEQFEQAGYEQIVINDFAKEMTAHTGFGDWRLSRHKVVGLCGKADTKNPVLVQAPGFADIKLLK